MAELQAQTITGSLMAYLTYKQEVEANIKKTQKEMKEATEKFRNDLKHYRAQLKVTNYQIDKLTDDSLKFVRAGKTMEVTLTLDDFTPDQENIDIESAEKEMKAAQKAAKKK